jgi:two-component system response regulator NreC
MSPKPTNVSASLMISRPIRLVLAFNKWMDAAAYASLFDGTGEFDIISAERSLVAAAAACRREQPDAALVDAAFPEQESFKTAVELRRGGFKGRIALLDYTFAIVRADQALRLLHIRYFTRDEEPQILCDWLRGKLVVANKENTEVAPRVLQRTADDSNHDQLVLELTPKERQVMELIARGFTNQEIAKQLGRAVSTVDNHRSRIMKKLGVHRSTSLVSLAIRTGLLEASNLSRGAEHRSRHSACDSAG